ncbi:MAG: methionyl-tRNA formyltransferase [Bdellovibrionota bacterium]
MNEVKPKIIFWGSPEFSLPALNACCTEAEVLAVVTQPDKPRGRGHELLPTAVKAAALERNIPVYAPRSLRKIDEEAERLLAFLNKKEADFFVVVAYGNLLPESVLSLPLKAPVNIHGSLLPRWRGAAPIQRALEAGDAETGVSLQRMVMALDAGDVYLEKKCSLSKDDKSAEVFDRLSLLGSELITEFLKSDFESLVPTPQDPALITHAAKIDKQEAYWAPNWTAEQTHNKVRAFHLWPTVKIKFTDLQGKVFEVKVHSSKNSNEKVKEKSSLIKKDGRVYLSDASGSCVELLSLQVPGKGPAEAFQVFQNIEKSSWNLIK